MGVPIVEQPHLDPAPAHATLGVELVEEELDAMVHEICLLAHAQALDSLMGHEGNAARHYFAAFGKMVRREFSFARRSKRPPKDPVNALLSLGYTLLYHEMHTAVEVVGLDPYLGFMHEVDYGHAALASDLCEEFRFLVDALVLGLINRGELQQHDFQESETGGWFLVDTARKKFYAAFERKIRTEISHGEQTISYRRLFFNQAEQLARVITGEQSQYQPYLMR